MNRLPGILREPDIEKNTSIVRITVRKTKHREGRERQEGRESIYSYLDDGYRAYYSLQQSSAVG